MGTPEEGKAEGRMADLQICDQLRLRQRQSSSGWLTMCNRSQDSTGTINRRRISTTGLLVLTIALGLASRRFPMWQPVWMATYAGDVLWATMVYWWLALIAPRARTAVLASGSLAIAWGVEFSQLLHTPWLDSLRATTPGALVLGQGFLWSDLVCYTVGVVLAVAVDRWWLGFTQQSANALP
jgi:hypothetical protein